jgi:hypothetical protein
MRQVLMRRVAVHCLRMAQRKRNGYSFAFYRRVDCGIWLQVYVAALGEAVSGNTKSNTE